MAVVRGALLMLVIGVLSFALGFFVLSRLLGGSARPDGAQSTAAPIASSASDSAARPAPPAVPNRTTAPPHPITPPAAHVARSASVPGPSIDPVEEKPVQQPDALDSQPRSAPNSGSGNTDSSAASPANSDTNASGSRRRRHRNADPNAVQPSTTPYGSDSAGANAPSDDTPRPSTQAADDSDARHSSDSGSGGMYRVQIGVYSTKEAAEQEAQRVRDKGFDASVQTYTRDGRTLYRIQHGSFRERANAEDAKRRLNDAGVDAVIANP
jgi:cell division protein FtsN